MLKKLSFSLLLGASSMIGTVNAESTTTNTLPIAPPRPVTPTQTTTGSAIDQQLNQALQKAEEEVQVQFNNATRRDVVPRWDDKVQLQNAIIQLDVKKTLVNNFRGTNTLNNSPAVQAKLLELLNKSMITEGDLAELQSITTQEKQRLNANTPQH